MSKVMIISDYEKQVNKVFYMTVAEKFMFGISADKQDRIARPSIDIKFPDSDLKRVLAIVDYMTERGILPRVYVEHEGSGIRVGVLFKFEDRGRFFLAQWFELPELETGKFEVILINDFKVTQNIFDLFMNYFQELGYYYLSIADLGPVAGTIITYFWKVKLNLIEQGFPGSDLFE